MAGLPALMLAWRDGRSRFWCDAVIATGAMLSAALLPWPWSVPAMLFVLVGAYLMFARPADYGNLQLGSDGIVRFQRRQGPVQNAQVSGSSLVCSSLVVLHLRINGARRAARIVLWPDSMAAADFRQLCAALRWQRGRVSTKHHQQTS